MRMITKLVMAVALLAGTSSVATAEPSQWEIDKAHSRFGFEVAHIFSSVYGFFEQYEGVVSYDPAAPEKTVMEFTIDVGSIQTFIGKRDNHLRSADFFDAAKYPEIRFVSTSVTRQSDSRYDVSGTLTIKDVTKDVVLPFTFFGVTDHPLDKAKRVAGFEARLPLDRLEYHVGNGKFYELGVVGKEVQVVVSLEVLADK